MSRPRSLSASLLPYSETDLLVPAKKNEDVVLSLHSIMKHTGEKSHKQKTVSWVDSTGGSLVDIQNIPSKFVIEWSL